MAMKETLEIVGFVKCRENIPHGAVGKPDLYFAREGGEDEDGDGGNEIAVVIELKTSHNLLLPLRGTEIADLYARAYDHVFVQFLGRSTEHSNSCHPLAQLLGYMADNGKRFGILACASYASCLKIEGDGSNAIVHVSDRLPVGSPLFCEQWLT